MDRARQTLTLLAVDDEHNIVRLLTDNFTHEGFQVLGAANCDEADAILTVHTPQAILMDWNLPGISGVQYIKRLRRNDRTSRAAILMLSARSSDLDVCEALENGADDYIRKPFSVPEVIKRVRAVMRRRGLGPTCLTPPKASQYDANTVLVYGPLVLDEAAHRVTVEGISIDIGATELRLLATLIRSPGRLLSRHQLLENVWGFQKIVELRTVDVHISRLRFTLAEIGINHCIETVRNEGYRLRSP
jgi:two-component system phosphate regulon response regulator PhoB